MAANIFSAPQRRACFNILQQPDKRDSANTDDTKQTLHLLLLLPLLPPTTNQTKRIHVDVRRNLQQQAELLAVLLTVQTARLISSNDSISDPNLKRCVSISLTY